MRCRGTTAKHMNIPHPALSQGERAGRYRPGTWFTLVDFTAKEGLPMPWKELKIMDQREQFVRDWLSGE